MELFKMMGANFKYLVYRCGCTIQERECSHLTSVEHCFLLHSENIDIGRRGSFQSGSHNVIMQ